MRRAPLSQADLAPIDWSRAWYDRAYDSIRKDDVFTRVYWHACNIIKEGRKFGVELSASAALCKAEEIVRQENDAPKSLFA